MVDIYLKGHRLKIDAEDLPIYNKFKWQIKTDSKHTSYLQMKGYHKHLDRITTVKFHRLILDCPEGMEVDHINHDGLDNRRENLRICTRQQNSFNTKPIVNRTSKYKGVWWRKERLRWVAGIYLPITEENRKRVRKMVGSFKCEIEAAKAYNKAAKELFGEYAYLNEV